jgi:hypothetical protein
MKIVSLLYCVQYVFRKRNRSVRTEEEADEEPLEGTVRKLTKSIKCDVA